MASSTHPEAQPAPARAAIHVLDETTASRIAAGEVVERPASVVKELVENSLDAGARHIRVAIRGGGIESVRVTDDGSGIPRGEVELAFARHATSKLRSAADLERVRTMGFRGEALAAIASVSRVTMITRARGAEDGVRLTVRGGKAGRAEPCGAPVGTTIVAEDLFYAVPARRKFLASPTAEGTRIVELVGRLALAHPDVSFLLERDGKDVLHAPGTGDPRAAAAAVWGRDVAAEMLTARGEAPDGAQLVGLVSPPHQHRNTRRHIALYVNGRWVADRRLTFAVEQGYEGMLPRGRFPLVAVFLEVPAHDVDVNVHPAKTEVRLRHGDAVFGLVKRGVSAALSGAPMAPVAGPALRPATPYAWRTERAYAPETALAEGLDRTLSWLRDAAPEPERLPPLRPLGQVAAMYIVAEGPDGIYLVDQHAAHERVVYERLLSAAGGGLVQGLLPPVTVDVGPEAIALVEPALPQLWSLGFELEVFGPTTILARGVPEVVARGEPAALVHDVVESVAAGGTDPTAPAIRERAALAACKRGSVKAGQALTLTEMAALLEALERTAAPRTCPHGRPTVVVLSHRRLEREFGRV